MRSSSVPSRRPRAASRRRPTWTGCRTRPRSGARRPPRGKARRGSRARSRRRSASLGGTPRCLSSLLTTRAPASEVPASRSLAPSCFSSISARKLSLTLFIGLRSPRAVSNGRWRAALPGPRLATRAGAERGPPRRGARRKRASGRARRVVDRPPVIFARLTISADRAATHLVIGRLPARAHAPGVVVGLVPEIRPVTVRIPLARIACASVRILARVSVGSP